MRRTIAYDWLHAVALLVIACCSAGVCDEPHARTLLAVDGSAVAATLRELNPDWSIAVEVDGQAKLLAPSEYVLWGNYADQDRAAQVLLADGSVLVGDLARIEDGWVAIQSRLWGELRLDRRLVRACLMLPAADALERDRQAQMLNEPAPADRVLLLNGDAIAGKLLPTAQRDGGGLFGVASIGIELPGSESGTSVLTEEVRAVIFQAIEERGSQPECLLGFSDGSFVAALKLTPAEADQTEITTAAGASLRLRADEFLKSLTFVQPRSDTVTYLSDLPAVGYKSLPLLALDWPLGIAANALGGRLRSGGHVAFKGLGMHSASRVAYDLDGEYRRFQAELALDDHAGRKGSVVYRVLVERESEPGQRAWTLAFTSPTVRGGDAPLSMSLDVAGATRLALVVEMADRADTCDYANWLNARLIR